MRRPSALELAIPVERASWWSERLLALCALLLLFTATDVGAWGALPALLLLLGFRQGPPSASSQWHLQFDGEHWHWAGDAAGTGRLQRVLTVGSWCLVKATPFPGRGHTAWIWIPVHRLGATGHRLQTLLNWT